MFKGHSAWKNLGKKVILYLLTIFVSLISIGPIVFLLITSFKEPELTSAIPPVWRFIPTLQNYREVLTLTDFRKYFFNSLLVGLTATSLAVVLGTFAAYGFSRFRFRGMFWLRMSALVPQMLPPIVLVVPFYILFMRINLTDKPLALIVAYLTFTVPLSVWMMIGFFDDIPVELEQQAMIDGSSRFGALIRVNLPLVLPGIAATAILNFIYCWNEFLYAVILTGRNARTLPVTITSYMTHRAILWGRIAAAGSLVLIPVLIFSLVAQRYLIRGLSGGAIKG